MYIKEINVFSFSFNKLKRLCLILDIDVSDVIHLRIYTIYQRSGLVYDSVLTRSYDRRYVLVRRYIFSCMCELIVQVL